MSPRSPRRPRPAPLLDLMQAPDTSGIDRLHALLNWCLLKGSHEFPGPAGGTCIIEAAIVAAGWAYAPVRSVKDAPADFSPVVSEYLLRLNDRLRDDERQQLVPFVTRISDSAGSAEIETAREDFIVAETVRCHLSLAMAAVGRHDVAAKCRAVRAGDPYARRMLRNMADEYLKRRIALWSADAAWAVEISMGAAKVHARGLAPEAAATARKAIVDRAIAIADEALVIGRQAQPIDPLTALVRLEAQRPQPPRRAGALN